MILADSDVLIDFLRGKEPSARRIRSEIATGGLATTAINAFELLSGAKAGSERAKIARLLAALNVLHIDQTVGAAAAEIRRQLEERGESIGMADYLIAGVCLVRQATLLTRNKAHFSRIPGLKLSGFEL
jgi:tRNA(fMet)-specific endonuclease VapC